MTLNRLSCLALVTLNKLCLSATERRQNRCTSMLTFIMPT